MSFIKERLATISGLNITFSIADMDDERFAAYSDALLTFTEDFPLQETKIKQSFAAKDYKTSSRLLTSIREDLEGLQAIGLLQSCRRLIEELNDNKNEIAEAHSVYLLAELAALSIDIQMSQYTISADISTPTFESIVGRQKNILAVDDVALLLRSLKSALQDTEYNLVGVTSGDAALRYIDKYKPDLFILDIEMPDMNGYELAGRIKERGMKAPIIFLTGNAKQEYVVKAIKAGAVDFIVKPVNKDQVLEKIKKQIG